MGRAKKYDTNAVQLKRIIAACAILAIFFLLLIAYGQFQPAIENAKAYQDLLADNNEGAKNLPTNFSEEVLSPENYGAINVEVNDTQNVVGFVCAGSQDSAETLAEKIKSTIQAKGWVFLDSGINSIFSAKKNGGKYTYAYIQLTEIDKDISVVFTLA